MKEETFYKKGDIVVIRGDLIAGETCYSINNQKVRNVVIYSMIKYADKKATIVRVTPFGQYELDIDRQLHFWTDGMFTGRDNRITIGKIRKER